MTTGGRVEAGWMAAALALLTACGAGAPGADAAPLVTDASGSDSIGHDAATGEEVGHDSAPGEAIGHDAATGEEIGHDAATGDGPSGITPGQALGKLCHELNRSGLPIELTLELGDPVLARISARTGVRAPPAGTPCLGIPVGTVLLRLREGDRVLAIRSVILGDGNEYIFQPVIGSSGQIAISGGRVNAGMCAALDFPAADGGRPEDGGPADAAVGGD